MNPISGDLTAQLDQLYPLALTLWGNPSARLALLFFAVAIIAALALPGDKSKQGPPRRAVEADKPLPKVGGQSFIERRRSPTRFERPLSLHGRTYETYERLIGIASIPGTGKSSILAEMMWQSGGRCIVVSGGKSPPLIDTVYAMGGRHWETTGTLGIDLLSGDYRRVPQVLEEMFDKGSGDGGLFRSLFRQITRDYLKAVDAAGIPRSFGGIVDALKAAKPADYPGVNPTMIGNWAARMNEVLDSLGPALGTDLNVLDACLVGVPVLFTLDKRRDPSGSLRRMFAKAAISAGTQAVAAGHAPMFLIDEIGLLDADAIAEDARTFREAGVLFAAAGHGKQDFGTDLRSLCDFWIFGTLAADEPETRKWASETTFGTISPQAFGGHALAKGHFVIWDGSRVHDDLIVPRYSRRDWIWSTPELPERTVPKIERAAESAGQTIPVEIDSVVDSVRDVGKWKPAPVVEGPAVMPQHWKGDAQLENIWLHHVFPGGADGCHVSTYRLNNRGRPMCSYLGVDWMAYMLSLALAHGLNLGEVKMRAAAGELTVDHICQNIRCTRADHLTWESRSRNSELLHERRRSMSMVSAAD